MDKVMNRDNSLFATLIPALLLVAVACAMVVILYGMESVAPGVHDIFHDFRHTIGMPCH